MPLGLALDDDDALGLDDDTLLELEGGRIPPFVRRARTTLGRAESRVFLMDQMGRRVVEDLSGVTSFLSYGRELNSDSELELSLHVKGNQYKKCLEAVQRMSTWRHELMVIRGDGLTWGPGPIVTIGPGQKTIAHIVARDVIAWLDVRMVHEDHSYKQVDVVDVARHLIVDGLTKGKAAQMPTVVRDVGILSDAEFTPAGKPVDFEVKSNQRTVGECLRDLSEKGLTFMCLGRKLVVGGDFAFGPVGPLKDEHFYGPVETSEHGLLAVTNQHVTGGVGKQGEWGGPDDYYGLIEVGVEGEAATNNPVELTRMARERWRQGFPPPVSVNVPSEGGLRPTAPITQDQLVPGTAVHLELLEVLRPVVATHRITQVDFSAGNDAAEQIAATFAPLGAAAGAFGAAQ